MERKMKDIIRAAKRRSMETPEQRAERLRKDRERASRRRVLRKITQKSLTSSSCWPRLDDLSELGAMGEPVKVGFQDGKFK